MSSLLRRPRYAPHLPPIVAGMNRAGSVGKTTIGHNAAVIAAKRGYKVLEVDGDLQSDMSYWNGYDGDLVPAGVATVHDVMLGRAKLTDAIVPGRTRIAAGDDDDAFEIIPNLDLVRGAREMSQADSELTLDPRGVFWLQLALKNQIKEGQYDLIWLDCPASLGRLSISLVLAATEVMVATKPTRKEMRGAAALSVAIDEVREAYGDDFGATASASFYVINEAKSHSGQGAVYLEIQEEAEQLFGDKLLPSIGPSVRVPEAYGAQEPVAIWDPKAPIVKSLGKILDRLGYPDPDEIAA